MDENIQRCCGTVLAKLLCLPRTPPRARKLAQGVVPGVISCDSFCSRLRGKLIDTAGSNFGILHWLIACPHWRQLVAVFGNFCRQCGQAIRLSPLTQCYCAALPHVCDSLRTKLCFHSFKYSTWYCCFVAARITYYILLVDGTNGAIVPEFSSFLRHYDYYCRNYKWNDLDFSNYGNLNCPVRFVN